MRRTKDSNLVWIGAIPEDWSVLRGKNVVKKLKRPVKETDGVIIYRTAARGRLASALKNAAESRRDYV